MNFFIKYLKKAIPILTLFPFFCFAQNSTKYRIKFNALDTPTLVTGGYGNYKVKTPNAKINSIFARYKINDFKKIYPSAETPKLKLIYVIQADSSLIIELKQNASHLIIEKEPEIETLIDNSVSYLLPQVSIPNDYGLALLQPNLNLINASEAWQYTTGNSNFRIGVVDGEPFDIGHPELEGKIFIAPSASSNAFFNYSSQSHGTSMAGLMAGKTNNGIGLASIGYNCAIEADMNRLDACNAMSKRGIKVINNSWRHTGIPPISDDQLLIDEMYNRGTILVFAAGNDNNAGLVYPAANNHVISVASIGSSNSTFGSDTSYTDSHEFYRAFRSNDPDNSGKMVSQSHNKEVDILAPGYFVPNIWDRSIYYLTNGSSCAAPHVAGTIGLMFSINSSLTPLEVETILKLTAANIEQLPRNIQYAGMLGAGRLDAGKAVKMAFNMINQDTILISNKDFYRWPLSFGTNVNAPFAIKVDNEILRDSVKADFIARKCITITNSTLKPNLLGNINFSTNPNKLNYSNGVPIYLKAKTDNDLLTNNLKSGNENKTISTLKVYPIPANNKITITTGLKQVSDIKLFNLNGVLVKTLQTNGSGVASADVSNLPVGVYILQASQNNKMVTSKVIISR